MSFKLLYGRGRGILTTVGGFVVGWYSLSFVEEKKFVSERHLNYIHVASLKLQLLLQEWVLPVAFSEKYGCEKEALLRIIERYERSNAPEERWTFEQLLMECQLPEQIAWLEEHISEDIPYFYIADLFSSWCNLHKYLFLRGQEAQVVTTRNEDHFKSQLLCKGIVDKTISGVLPFDVAVRTLCILARGCKANAQFILEAIKPDTILDRYKLHVEHVMQKSEEIISDTPVTEVNAATLALLSALNATLQEYEGFKFWKNSAARQHPVAAQLNPKGWCTSVVTLSAGLETTAPSDVVQFVQNTSKYLQCLDHSE